VSGPRVPQTLAPRAIAACAAVALALAGAACDDDDEPTADFPDAADDICLDVARQLADARDDVAPPDSPKEAADLLEVELPNRLDGLRRLQELQPPPELINAWNQYLTVAESRIDAADQELTAAKDSDEEAFREAQARFERLSDEARDIGEQAGLEACAEVLPPAGQEDVLTVVEKLFTSRDSKKVCDELVTERFVDSVYGSREKCESERGLPTAASLDLLDVGGVASISAFVDVKLTDYLGRIRQIRVELVFDEDSETWKVDYRQTLVEPPGEEKAQTGGGETGASGETGEPGG
jgi:hypothetical protein